MKLYQHQTDAITRAKKTNLLLEHDPGTGKTVSTIAILKHFKKIYKGNFRSLVVAPLTILESSWMKDLKKFAPGLTAVNLWSGDYTIRYARLHAGYDVCVINFEQFRSLYPALCKRDIKVLIVDESSRMKSYTTQTTRALLALAGYNLRRSKGVKFDPPVTPIPHRYCLSGTPAPNDPFEYACQMMFLSKDIIGDNYYRARSVWCHKVQLGRSFVYLYPFKKSNQHLFTQTLAPVIHIARKEDLPDMPKKVYEVREVTLDDKERESYDRFRDDLVLRYAGETILGTTALTEIAKLRQLSGGFFYKQASKDTVRIGKSKITALLELLDEIGPRQAIIWCQFTEDIEAVQNILKKKSVALYGKTSDRESVIQAYQSKKIPYLIAQPQAAAHGLSLPGSYAIYYSLSYSYEQYLQSQDRIHGIGRGDHKSTSRTYYHLIAKDTIDEVLYQALNKKGSQSQTGKDMLNYLQTCRKGKRRYAAI